MKTEQHSTTQHSKAKLALGEPAGEGDDGKHCFSTQVLLHNWMLPSPHTLLTKQFSIIHFRKCKTQKCRGISQMHFFLRNCYSNVSFLYRMFVERMKVDNSGVSTLTRSFCLQHQHPVWALVQVLVALLQIQPLANGPGKAAEEGPRLWALYPCRRWGKSWFLLLDQLNPSPCSHLKGEPADESVPSLFANLPFK